MAAIGKSGHCVVGIKEAVAIPVTAAPTGSLTRLMLTGRPVSGRWS